MNQITELQTRQDKLRALLEEMRELSQPRSNYALRHFVVGQHDLPARQRQQVLLELQALMFELANQADEIRLLGLDLEDLRDQLEKAEGRDRTRLEIQIGQKERAVESISILLDGRMRECDTLYAMLQEMPPVTGEKLEAEEEAYWAARLSRQFYLAQRDAGGNLTAILQMLTQPGQPRPEIAASLPESIKTIGLTDAAIKKLNGGSNA